FCSVCCALPFFDGANRTRAWRGRVCGPSFCRPYLRQQYIQARHVTVAAACQKHGIPPEDEVFQLKFLPFSNVLPNRSAKFPKFFPQCRGTVPLYFYNDNRCCI